MKAAVTIRLMIGCADLIRGFPNPETAMLGLLLISEAQQKKGYGKLAYEATERLVLSWAGTRKIRIGVISENIVLEKEVFGAN